MEGVFQNEVLTAPKPTTDFEEYVIKYTQRTTAFEAYMIQFAERTSTTLTGITESISDLSESIAYVANVTVTKEEFEERLKDVATKEDLKREIGAAEHRIKSYIDDKVVAQNVMPVIQKEDKKVNSVIDSLEENSVFSSTEAEFLKQQGPFPHLA